MTEKISTPVQAEKVTAPRIEQLADPFGKTDPFDWDLSATLGRELEECNPASISMPFLDEDSTPSTPVRTSPTISLTRSLPLEESVRLDGGFLPPVSAPSAPSVPLQPQTLLTNPYPPIQFQVPQSQASHPPEFQTKAKKRLSARAKPFAVVAEPIAMETQAQMLAKIQPERTMGTGTTVPFVVPIAVPVTYHTQTQTQIPPTQTLVTSHLPTHVQTHVQTHIPTHVSTHVPTHLSTHVPPNLPTTSTNTVTLEPSKSHSHTSTHHHRRSRSTRTERPKTPDSDSSIEGLLERYEVARSGKGKTHYDLSDDSTTQSEGLNFTLRGGRGDAAKSRSRSSKAKIETQVSSSVGVWAKFVAFISLIFSFFAAIADAIYEGFSACCHRLGDRRPSARSRRSPSPMSRRAVAREASWR